MAIVIKKTKTIGFHQLTPAMAWMLYTLERIARMVPDWPPEIVITAINDGVHSERSRHYTDEAIDIRSKNFPSRNRKIQFVNTLAAALNDHHVLKDKFTVLFESEGTENEHFHVQVKKGMKFLEEQV